jgi:hypothetical protein
MENGLSPRELVARQAYSRYVLRSDVERELREQPFWRFRRKQALARDLARLRKSEWGALELLGGRPVR